jgi:hypothetical protein
MNGLVAPHLPQHVAHVSDTGDPLGIHETRAATNSGVRYTAVEVRPGRSWFIVSLGFLGTAHIKEGRQFQGN